MSPQNLPEIRRFERRRWSILHCGVTPPASVPDWEVRAGPAGPERRGRPHNARQAGSVSLRASSKIARTRSRPRERLSAKPRGWPTRCAAAGGRSGVRLAPSGFHLPNRITSTAMNPGAHTASGHVHGGHWSPNQRLIQSRMTVVKPERVRGTEFEKGRPLVSERPQLDF